MNLFENFHTQKYDDTCLFKHNGKNITLKDFKKFVADGAGFLNTQNSERVVILSSSVLDFAIWFFACIFADKKIFLLTDASKLQYLDFDYIVVDKHVDYAQTNSQCEFLKIVPDKVFINFYTSGSTAIPKTVTKSLTNILTEVNDVYDTFFNTQEFAGKQLKFLSSTLTQHMFAFSFYFALPLCYLNKFVIDTTEVCYPDDADFKDSVFISTPSFLEKFQKHKVKNVCAPVIIFSAGARLADEVFKYLEQYSIVVDIYGSTETSTVAYRLHSADKFLTCLDSVKTNIDDNLCLVVSSPYFLTETITLGDTAMIESPKHFRLNGRADRVFKIQEKRVSAPEVENTIMQVFTDFVQDCYCFKFREKLACSAVLTDNGRNYFAKNGHSIAVLTSFLKNSLKGKTEIVPQKWKFLYELPKTKTGKIDRLKIEKIFATNVSMPFVFSAQKDSNNAVFELIFPSSCNFFTGHFNSFPVLPGVVQLYFAHFFAVDAFGDSVLNNCVKKIKFSKIIKPEENLKLVFERKNNLINYMYKRDEQVCSSGVMTLNEKD